MPSRAAHPESRHTRRSPHAPRPKRTHLRTEARGDARRGLFARRVVAGRRGVGEADGLTRDTPQHIHIPSFVSKMLPVHSNEGATRRSFVKRQGETELARRGREETKSTQHGARRETRASRELLGALLLHNVVPCDVKWNETEWNVV